MTDIKERLRKFANVFAEIGSDQATERDALAEIERLESERDAWTGAAAQFHRNAEYYRGLIDAAAPTLGAAMYTQDDGGIVSEPLRAKLPDVVANLRAERDALKAANERMEAALKTCVVTMKHAQVFISSREKMHRDGQSLFQEDIDNAARAIAESDRAAKGASHE